MAEGLNYTPQEAQSFKMSESEKSLRKEVLEFEKNNPQTIFRKLMTRINDLIVHSSTRYDKTLEIVQKELSNLDNLDRYYQHDQRTNSEPWTSLPDTFESEKPRLLVLEQIVKDYEQGNISQAQSKLGEYRKEGNILQEQIKLQENEKRNNEIKKIDEEIAQLQAKRQKLIEK